MDKLLENDVEMTPVSTFEPRRSEIEHAIYRSLRLPAILNLYEWVGKEQLVSLKPEHHAEGALT